ncbi:MAG: hypothetical protein LBR34_10535 [Prevotella sp.]|jgi:hypothetical protein|nr:hypothetical protein [Prevotella sp.]
MASKSNNHLAYGLTIMVFGLLFLLSWTGILAKLHIQYLMNIGVFFLIAGIIFLLTSGEKLVGIVSTIIGTIIVVNNIWFHFYPNLLAPVLLILSGLILVIFSKT